MSYSVLPSGAKREPTTIIHGARCAAGPCASVYATIEVFGNCVKRIVKGMYSARRLAEDATEIDLSGYLLMPGLINAHDHLEFALYPRLADPPYCNYIQWGEDIHKKYPDVIARHHAVPKDLRLWWGGIRNLLCGATTVCHHNPLWPVLKRDDFPIRVVQGYGWAHSLALGGDLPAARAATPANRAFVVHACEGVDDLAGAELWELDRMGLLDGNAVLVHGLALDSRGIALMNERAVSLIVCPSSNDFLFGRLPNLAVLGAIKRVALGSDSPLTAAGDLLDEIRFAIDRCGLLPQEAYCKVTTVSASILRLKNAEGSIMEGGVADLVAVRDRGGESADQLCTIAAEDVEFVMIGGRVQLASEAVLERLSPQAREGLEPLVFGPVERWLRAPVQELLQGAEEVLGKNGVRIGCRTVRAPTLAEAAHAC